MTEDDKVKAYMAAHPELVAQVAEKHGVEVVDDEELEEEGLPSNYLEQTVEEESKTSKPRRFGHGSNAEGDNDTTI